MAGAWKTHGSTDRLMRYGSGMATLFLVIGRSRPLSVIQNPKEAGAADGLRRADERTMA
jgi:hypothetical protein